MRPGNIETYRLGQEFNPFDYAETEQDLLRGKTPDVLFRSPEFYIAGAGLSEILILDVNQAPNPYYFVNLTPSSSGLVLLDGYAGGLEAHIDLEENITEQPNIIFTARVRNKFHRALNYNIGETLNNSASAYFWVFRKKEEMGGDDRGLAFDATVKNIKKFRFSFNPHQAQS